MYLKELVLENFKSFGGKTRITLQPGYTVITGPNGSGKSNISDAILFVLGPRSSKVIRAGKLTDLIYNGGKSRNSASHASVSATFDNTARIIPYDSDEVTFTRIVRRSQDGDDYASHFYINGRKSSLGEFEQLLREAKLSADGYNFVRQGDVTRIIEMGNAERRRILDDIAGITAFDSEIERAEGERSQIEQNLATAKSVLSELKTSLQKLEKEKEAAEKYTMLRKQLQDMKLTLALRKLSTSDVEMETIRNQIESFSKQIDELAAEIEREQAEISSAEQKLREKEEQIAKEEGEEAREIRRKVDDCKIEIAKRTDGAATASEQLEEIQDRLKELNARMKAEKKKMEELKQTLAFKEKKAAEIRKELNSCRAELSELEKNIGDSDEKSRKIQSEIISLSRQISDIDERIGKLKIEADRLKDRTERDAVEIARLEDTKKNLELEYKDVGWQLKEINSGYRDRETMLRELQTKYTSLRNKERELVERTEELERETRALTREYERLKIQREARTDGLSRALNAILELRDRNEIAGILGTFRELVEIDEKYEQAINAAAGGRMNAIVVETDAVAAQCIMHLKKNGLGRLTFLPLNRMLEGRPRGKAVMSKQQTLGFAIDLMRFDEKLRAAAWYVVGDTLVVRNLDELRQLMGGVRIVTLDGDIAEASGAMIGGSVEKAQPAAREISGISEVSEKLRAANIEMEQRSSELKAVRAELSVVEETIRKVRDESGETGRVVEELNSKKKQLEKDINERAMQIAGARERLRETEGQLEEINEEIRKKEEEVDGLKKLRESRNRELIEGKPEEIAANITRLREQSSRLAEELSTVSGEITEAKTALQYVEKGVQQIESEIEENEAHAQELREKITESNEEAERLKVELSALMKIESRLGETQAELKRERDALLQNIVEGRAKLSKASERKEALSEMVIIQKTNLQNAAVKRREIENEIESLRSTGASEIKDETNTERLRERISETEKTLERMGGVNMLAIEDYEQVSSRCNALSEEIEKFEEKRKSLVKLVDEINRKKREGLLNVFNAINSNFREIYARLSGGAEGELQLENQDDPLQGGLIIKVKQRDRKQLRIEALSGGEKSLAALAFIFAIQQHDPSPVYFLDEVDMFLDGVNSEAVARMVKSLSSSAQFLQVSLRKVTLNWADRLIGVTRGEDSVSHVFYRDVSIEEEHRTPQGVES
jgi:chromosome segregation protein